MERRQHHPRFTITCANGHEIVSGPAWREEKTRREYQGEPCGHLKCTAVAQ